MPTGFCNRLQYMLEVRQKRSKADYDMITNWKFCTYGAVKKGAE